jgi:hypothetical protein
MCEGVGVFLVGGRRQDKGVLLPALAVEGSPMTWEWKSPVFSVGWIVALVVMIATLLLGFMDVMPKEWMLAIVALCAVRL